MPSPCPLPCSFGSGSYRAYPGAPEEEAGRPPQLHKCPRCSREFLSTVNQRRCISSHLGARGGGPKAARNAGPGARLAAGVRGAAKCAWLPPPLACRALLTARCPAAPALPALPAP